MFEKFKFTLHFIQFATILCIVNAQCNTCDADSGITCTSATEYAICINGVPANDMIASCPTNLFCNLDTVCGTTTPSCTSSCGVCTADLRFACVDTNKFRMCYGTTTPASPVLTCPSGSVCDFNAAPGSFCGPAANIPAPVCSGPYVPTTVAPVLPTQPSTGTTLDRWTSWCRNLNLAGRFPYTTDKTCQAYILCFVNNNLLYGNYYKCQGSSVYNPFYQTCVAPENYECPE